MRAYYKANNKRIHIKSLKLKENGGGDDDEATLTTSLATKVLSSTNREKHGPQSVVCKEEQNTNNPLLKH